jgi:tRNA(fMet)-specific endonuclease VapC
VKYLLDTDTCIYILKQRQPILDRFFRESPDDVAVSSMTEAELRFGALKSAHPGANRARMEAFLAPLQVLPFDGSAARRHADARLALRSAPIGERDLVIAAVALANGLVLVTNNTREFGRIPGLAMENWA